MNKLNLTKEIAFDIKKNLNCYWDSKRIDLLASDWFTMYTEIERLNKSLKEAVEEIEIYSKKIDRNYKYQTSNERSYGQGASRIFGILKSHFPELEVKDD